MDVSSVKAEMVVILGDGSKWCKKWNAVDSDGNPCPIKSDRAVKWDIFGALLKAVSNETDYKAFADTYNSLMGKIPTSYKNRDIESYNDSVTWAELKLLMV